MRVGDSEAMVCWSDVARSTSLGGKVSFGEGEFGEDRIREPEIEGLENMEEG